MAASTSRKRSGGAGLFLMIFGLPFLATGVWTFYSSIAMLTRWVQAGEWVETPATIQSVDLEQHTGSKGSTTHEVICTYQYAFDGESYTNDRVGLRGGGDSIGSWQQRTHRRLKEHLADKEPVTCYVDPADPTRAVLDRSLRLELFGFYWVFVITFGGAGAAMVIGGWYLQRSQKRKAEMRQRHPDEPWAWNPQWQEGVLRTNIGVQAVALWVITILWNTLGGWPVFFIPGELADGNYLILLVLLFPLVGALFLWGAIHTTLQWRRFGRSTFAMETMPGVIGGHLRGTLSIVGQLSAVDGVDVSLHCVRQWTTGSGKHKGTHTETLYEDRRNYPVSQRFGETEARLPIDFQIPYDCKPTAPEGDSVEWKLKAEADIPGVDLELEFTVPVYHTDESSPDIGRSAETLALEEAMVTSDEAPQAGKVQISRDVGGRDCIECSAWPGAGLAITMLIAGIVGFGVAGFSVYKVMQGDYTFIIFLLGFSLMGLGMLAAVLTFLGRWRVLFGTEDVRVERLYAIGRRTKEIPRDAIDHIEYKRSGSTNDVPYYAIHLVSDGGTRTKIAGGLQGLQMAKWLAHRVESQLGLQGAVWEVETANGH